jgi:hypothetical protein
MYVEGLASKSAHHHGRSRDESAQPDLDYGLGKPYSIFDTGSAATDIENTYNKPVVIYTDGGNWQLITGNCGSTGTNSCPSLIFDMKTGLGLKLWDVEHKIFYAGDGTQHCGDGVAGLVPWKPWGSTTWQTRSGNQYDWGLFKPGASQTGMGDTSWDDDTPEAKSAGQCITNTSRTLFGLTSVELDYFDPTLFSPTSSQNK